MKQLTSRGKNMKTFNEFIDQKEIKDLVEQAANLMVEMDIEPTQFILEFVSKDPEVEKALLEYIEIQEGLLDGLKDLGKRAMSAAAQFGKNVWSGGGITGGAEQAMDTLVGPMTKFNRAVSALNDLVKSLSKDPQLAGMRTSDNKYTLPKYLSLIINKLEQERHSIPKMQQAIVKNSMKQGVAPSKMDMSKLSAMGNNNSAPASTPSAMDMSKLGST